MKIYYEKPLDYENNKYDYLSLEGIGKDRKKVKIYYDFYDAMVLPEISKDFIRWGISNTSTFEEMKTIKEIVVQPPIYPCEIVELLKVFSEGANDLSVQNSDWPYIKHPNLQLVYKDWVFDINLESWFKDVRLCKNVLLELFIGALLDIEGVYLVYYHDFVLE